MRGKSACTPVSQGVIPTARGRDERCAGDKGQGVGLTRNRLDQGAALAGVVLLGTAAAIPTDSLPWMKVVLAIIEIADAALSMTCAAGTGASIALVAAFLVLAGAAGVLWQAAMPLALLAYLLASKLSPSLSARGWWTFGRIPWLPTILCAAVAPFALVHWVLVMTPDIDDLLRRIPQVSLPLLLAGAVLFTFVNSTGEELIWRGLFEDRLLVLFGPLVAVVIQGVSFGAQHAQGFPRGMVGVSLAAVWGLMLGWLRRRSGGILAPICAHVVADATVAAIVLVLARPF